MKPYSVSLNFNTRILFLEFLQLFIQLKLCDYIGCISSHWISFCVTAIIAFPRKMNHRFIFNHINYSIHASDCGLGWIVWDHFLWVDNKLCVTRFPVELRDMGRGPQTKHKHASVKQAAPFDWRTPVLPVYVALHLFASSLRYFSGRSCVWGSACVPCIQMEAAVCKVSVREEFIRGGRHLTSDWHEKLLLFKYSYTASRK